MNPIFAALVERDGQTTSEIAAACGGARDTVGRRLRMMRDRGIVTSNRSGGSTRWSIVAGSEMERRHDLHASILDALANGPRTTMEIVALLGISRTVAYGRLCTLERRRLVHSEVGVSTRWMLREHTTVDTDADRSINRTIGHRRTIILEALADRPATIAELADRLGWPKPLTSSTVYRMSDDGLVIGTPIATAPARGNVPHRYELTYRGRRRLARLGGSP